LGTQDFINGGFYGKVGQFVGRRHGNTRDIYAYTIPHDPKTPAQLARRQLWAHAVELTHIAFNNNKGDPSWQGVGKTEWSARVKTAISRLDRGWSDADSIPFYPDGFVSFDLFTGVASTVWNSGRVLRLEASGPIRDYARTLHLTWRMWSDESMGWFENSFNVSIAANAALLANIALDRTKYSRNSQGIIAGTTINDPEGQVPTEFQEIVITTLDYPQVGVTPVSCYPIDPITNLLVTAEVARSNPPPFDGFPCYGNVPEFVISVQKNDPYERRPATASLSFSYGQRALLSFTSPYSEPGTYEAHFDDLGRINQRPDNISCDLSELASFEYTIN
jgi:hypothetical protein